MTRRNGMRALLVLMPAGVFAALRVFNPGGGVLVPSVVFGLLAGALLYLCFCHEADRLLGDFSPLKVAALLSPHLLLAGYVFLWGRSPGWWLAVLLLFAVLCWLAFVRPLGRQRAGASLCLLSVVLVLAHCILSGDNFTPDSYSFMELAKGMFTRPLRVDTIRQYQVFTDYGISFPYLYPLAAAVVNAFTGLGIYSGVMVNLLAAVASAALLYKISMRLAGTALPGGLAAVFLLGNPEYMNEVAVARTIPLAILCSLLALHLLCRLPGLRGREAFLAGLAAGAGAVVRFDALATAVCGLAVVLVFTHGGGRWKNGALFLAGGLVFTLPWVVYSLALFGTPWVSDNMGTLLLAEAAVPNRYFSAGYTPATLQSDPGAWFVALFGEKLSAVATAFGQCLAGGGGLLVLVWAGYMLAHDRLKGGKGALWRQPEARRLWAVTLVAAAVYLLKTGALLLVGYDSVRYHLEACTLLVLMAGCVSTSGGFAEQNTVNPPRGEGPQGARGPERSDAAGGCVSTGGGFAEQNTEGRSLYAHTALLVGLLLAVQFAVWPARQKLPLVGKPEKGQVLSPATVAGQWDTAEAMVAFMTAEAAEPRVLFLDGDAAFRFGAYTGLCTFVPPVVREDDPRALDELIQSYVHPDFIVAMAVEDKLARDYGLEPVMETEVGTVYRVTLRTGW